MPPKKATVAETPKTVVVGSDDAYFEIAKVIAADKLEARHIELAHNTGLALDFPHSTSHLTLLQFAAKVGSEQACKLLLTLGADPGIRDVVEDQDQEVKKKSDPAVTEESFNTKRAPVEEGNNVAHICVLKGLNSVLATLIQHPHAKEIFSVKNSNGMTPLALACQTGNVACTKILLSAPYGMEPDYRGRNYVYHLVASHQHDAIALISNLNFPLQSLIDKSGAYAFNGASSAMILAIEAKLGLLANPKTLPFAYDAAIRCSDWKLLDLCIRAGPLVDDKINNLVVSLNAIMLPGIGANLSLIFVRKVLIESNKRSMDILKRLISSPDTVNQVLTLGGRTLLHFACGAGLERIEDTALQVDLVRFLRDLGGKFDIQDSDSMTPADYAKRIGLDGIPEFQ